MTLRYLFGPVTDTFVAEQMADCQNGSDVRFFGGDSAANVRFSLDDSWERVAEQFSEAWQPDFIALHLPYRMIPEAVWDAGVPIVGIAADWQYQWHHYRRCLHRCDLVLADQEGASALSLEGIDKVVVAPLTSPDRPFAVETMPWLQANQSGDRDKNDITTSAFAARWREALVKIEEKWPEVERTGRQRQSLSAEEELSRRVWQQLNCRAELDMELFADLGNALADSRQTAHRQNLMGLVMAAQKAKPGTIARPVLEQVIACFRKAVAADEAHISARLNLAEGLFLTQNNDAAVEQVRLALAALQEPDKLDPLVWDAGHFPVDWDLFRIEWERAAWQNPGDRPNEIDNKISLLRWRLHLLLAEVTGQFAHYYEAVLARPEIPVTRAALGCALAREGWLERALPHLRFASKHNPVDVPAARALNQILQQTNRTQERVELIDRMRASVQSAENQSADSTFRIIWWGDQLALHSLALVNRELCERLGERGHHLSLQPPTSSQPPSAKVKLTPRLRSCWQRPLPAAPDFHIRLQWPPDFSEPNDGHWIMMQPWEYGALPKDWLEPMRDRVDEVWVNTRFVRDGFIQSGLPAEQVQIIPLGIEPARFQIEQKELPLPTKKRFKFLFVGGTIFRKGADILLRAFAQAFSAKDDVCLVIKDMGTGTFYRGQTAEAEIAELQRQPQAPEVVHLTAELSADELLGLYAACDCLVHPYRGEGFGLPIVEAMAMGLPVIVTGQGAAVDFCCAETSFLIPAEKRYFNAQRVGDLETVTRPWLAEPDGTALVELLRHVVDNPDDARAKGLAARRSILQEFTWERAVATVEERLRAAMQQPIRRLS